MKQRHVPHAAGTFARCATCEREPRHYVATGTTSSETVAFNTVGDRHQLECNCRRCTGWCGTLDVAVTAWGRLGETMPLQLRQASNVRPMRPMRRLVKARATA